MLLSGAAPQAMAQSLSAADRAAVVDDVVKHFRENPSELLEAIVAWREKQDADRLVALTPVSGNPSGDVTLFEFPDYGCAPCRQTSAAVDRVAAEDGAVRVVHHDFPASGPDAASAAADLLAAYAGGKDWKALRKAYIADGAGPETRIKALSDAGVELVEADRAGTGAVLLANRNLARKAGVSELPAVIVAAGGKMQALKGPITATDLEAAVAAIRKAASAR